MPLIPKMPRVKPPRPHITPHRPPRVKPPRPHITPHRPPRVKPKPRVSPRPHKPVISPKPRTGGSPRINNGKNIPHRNVPKRTGGPHIPQKTANKIHETPKTNWKDIIKSGLDWASTIGSLALTGYMGYELLNGGNEVYAEDYGYGDTGYEDYGYGDYGYGDAGYGGYGDYGYGDAGYGGYGDYGYGGVGYGGYDVGYGGYGDDYGLSDLGAGTDNIEDAGNLNDFVDDMGDGGESGYYYDPYTGEVIPDASENGVLDNLNGRIEDLSNKFGIPKEVFYLGGMVAMAGGLYYLTKKKKKKT